MAALMICSALRCWLGAVVLLLLVPGLVGCHRSSPRVFAFIPQMTADDVWEPSHNGALEAVNGTGYHIYWNGPTWNGFNGEEDVQSQISLMHAVIARRYKGIILAPVHSLALMIPVENALARGIPIVVLGSPLPLRAGGKLSYVLSDERAAGQMAAHRIGHRLHGSGEVAVLGIDPDVTGTVERVQAFEATLGSKFPHIRIVAERAASDSEAQAEQSTEDVLLAYPHLKAIFALTRTSTSAAFEALEESGRSKRVLLMGCGHQYELLYYLSEGWLDSILAENTYQMGREAAKNLLEENAGQHPPSVQFVEPVLITRQNMYQPALLPVLTHLGRD